MADAPADVMEAMFEEASLSIDWMMELMADPPGRAELMTDSTAEVSWPPTDSMRDESWAEATLAPTAATKTEPKRILKGWLME